MSIGLVPILVLTKNTNSHIVTTSTHTGIEKITSMSIGLVPRLVPT